MGRGRRARVLRHRHFRPVSCPAVERVRGSHPAALQPRRRAVVRAAASTTTSSTATRRATRWCTSVPGSGVLECAARRDRVPEGDYLVIPRGILHRYRFERAQVTCAGDREPRLRAHAEALSQRARAAHRERAVLGARHPAAREPAHVVDEKGEFRCRQEGQPLTEFVLDHHPFDVVGWDGYYYPWAFNIHDFEPRVGRIHLPPPVHQTFEGDGFVICSFCPRPYDFDPRPSRSPTTTRTSCRTRCSTTRAPSS
jgi:hypothetical protein